MRSDRPSLPRIIALTAALAGLVLLAGCDGGPAKTPRPSLDPSASPIIETDADFCEALDVLEAEHVILRQIRLRPQNRNELDDQFEQVQIAWQDMTRVAPRGMKAQLDAMRWAVIDLGIAIEDYTTTDRLAEAADHVLKRDIAFDRVLGRLRARTTCPPWQPTPKPLHTPSPGPSAAADASASPAPIGAASSVPASPSSPGPSPAG